MSVRAYRRPFLPLALAAFLAVGCEDSMTTAPIEAPAVNLDRSEEGLPFRLSGDATLLGRDLAPDFGPPEFGKSDFDGRCSVPSDYVIRFSIAGEATHMGEVSAIDEHCGLFDFQTGLGVSDSDGEMTITAANGDVLWLHHDRRPGEPDRGQFTGGTGRFTNASGEVVLQVVCNQAAGTCVLEMEGVLAYDASDRSE